MKIESRKMETLLRYKLHHHDSMRSHGSSERLHKLTEVLLCPQIPGIYFGASGDTNIAPVGGDGSGGRATVEENDNPT
jgi:hypothetical protein